MLSLIAMGIAVDGGARLAAAATGVGLRRLRERALGTQADEGVQRATASPRRARARPPTSSTAETSRDASLLRQLRQRLEDGAHASPLRRPRSPSEPRTRSPRAPGRSRRRARDRAAATRGPRAAVSAAESHGRWARRPSCRPARASARTRESDPAPTAMRSAASSPSESRASAATFSTSSRVMRATLRQTSGSSPPLRALVQRDSLAGLHG